MKMRLKTIFIIIIMLASIGSIIMCINQYDSYQPNYSTLIRNIIIVIIFSTLLSLAVSWKIVLSDSGVQNSFLWHTISIPWDKVSKMYFFAFQLHTTICVEGLDKNGKEHGIMFSSMLTNFKNAMLYINNHAPEKIVNQDEDVMRLIKKYVSQP